MTAPANKSLTSLWLTVLVIIFWTMLCRLRASNAYFAVYSGAVFLLLFGQRVGGFMRLESWLRLDTACELHGERFGGEYVLALNFIGLCKRCDRGGVKFGSSYALMLLCYRF